MMMTTTVQRPAVLLRDGMLDAALALVQEYDEMPAGAVLRCFSRAAVKARLTGLPGEQLTERTITMTRHMLASRFTR